MTDRLSTLYQDLLSGSYDCVDRIVLNAYFRMGHDPGGFRVWRRAPTGSDETLENTYLIRMAGGFSRRVRGYAKAHGIPVIDCSGGQRKHDLAEEYLAKTTVTQGLFLVLVGRAQAAAWDVNAKHHIERKKPMPYVNHYSFHILDPVSAAFHRQNADRSAQHHLSIRSPGDRQHRRSARSPAVPTRDRKIKSNAGAKSP
jgi:hypothetical protein